MKDKRRQRILEIIKNLRLMDDAFMTRFFDGNLECTSLVLQIIIEKPDLKVLEAKSQYYIKNLQGVVAGVKLPKNAGEKFPLLGI